MKVKCISAVTLGALDRAFVVGDVYDIPAKVLSDYPKYFEKMVISPKNKQATTQENK